MADQYLPHQVKLAEMEFLTLTMRRTDAALDNLGSAVRCFGIPVMDDLNYLSHDLQDGEWAQLTQAADASLVHVIFNNLSADQKEVLRSLLAKE